MSVEDESRNQAVYEKFTARKRKRTVHWKEEGRNVTVDPWGVYPGETPDLRTNAVLKRSHEGPRRRTGRNSSGTVQGHVRERTDHPGRLFQTFSCR